MEDRLLTVPLYASIIFDVNDEEEVLEHHYQVKLYLSHARQALAAAE